MPIERGPTAAGDGAAPKGGHFAWLVNEQGQRAAIKEGASLWIVEDPNDPLKIFPLVLKKVGIKALTFTMQGKDGALTEYKYQLQSAKPLNRAALQQLAKNVKPSTMFKK